MRRLALVLAALLAFPASAQGWAKASAGWQKISSGPGGTYATMPAPSGCVATSMPVFLGSPVALGCDTGYTYDSATDTLTVPATVSARNLTATALAAPTVTSVTPVLTKIGSITTVAGSALVDGDYFTIKYGGGTVPIQFDLSPGDGATGGMIPLLFTAGDSADTIRDNIILTLNAAAGTALTASSGGAATVAIVLDTPGAAGDTNTENVADAGFAVTGFSNPTAATTYGYKVTALLADTTTTAASAEVTTAAGHATLSASNYNTVLWGAVTGATSYKLYRTTGGAAPPKLIYTGALLTFDDIGEAGTAETPATANTTGAVTAGQIVGGTVAGTQFTFNGTGAGSFTIGTVGRLITNVNTVSMLQTRAASGIYGLIQRSDGEYGWASGTTVTGSVANDTILTRGGAAATLQLGAANSATPVAQRLKVQDGVGTNIAAAATAIHDGPYGTGTGAVGEFVIQTGAVQASGTTAHVPTKRLGIKELHINLRLGDVNIYANNAAALAGGLVAGDLYRTGADPDPVMIVH